jgi:hypothetical protein
VAAEKQRLVRAALLEQGTDDAERNRRVRSRAHGKVQVGLARERSLPGVDHDQSGACLLGVFDVRNQMDAEAEDCSPR